MKRVLLSVGLWSCLLALMAGSAVCLDGAVFFRKRRPLLCCFGVLGLLLDWALALFMFLLFSVSVYSSPSWAWVVFTFN
jgi:ABC-type enterobactin transport system permease subunit